MRSVDGALIVEILRRRISKFGASLVPLQFHPAAHAAELVLGGSLCPGLSFASMTPGYRRYFQVRAAVTVRTRPVGRICTMLCYSTDLREERLVVESCGSRCGVSTLAGPLQAL